MTPTRRVKESLRVRQLLKTCAEPFFKFAGEEPGEDAGLSGDSRWLQ
jgi:hypothetical protein